MALSQAKGGGWGANFLCDLRRLGPVVLPLRRVALDFGHGRLALLVEGGAGLGLLQGRVTIFSS